MIIAQIVARNEESRYLEKVLKNVSQHVDKIVFTDDCSTDNTAEIAAGYAHVYKNKESLFAVHEGQLRYGAWKNLENHAKVGDWILAIDADEMLFTKDNKSLSEVLATSAFDVVNVRRYEMWNDTQYRADKMWAPHNTFRIFRFLKQGVYKDKKLACGSEPTYVEDWVRRRNYWLHSEIFMQHLGYARDEDKQAKYDRYMTLDKGQFHNIVHLESIIDKNPVLLNWRI